MSTIRVSEVDEIERAFHCSPVNHLYPLDPAYRLSGAPIPHPGDVARCGHVKNTPAMGHGGDPRFDCPKCERLSRMAGLYPS